MTLPFENDTSKVIKKLADKSIKSNQRRNIFVIITIVIATAMFATFCLLSAAFSVSMLSNATNFTAAYINVPENKVELLAENSQFDKAGVHCRIPEREIDGNTLNLIYMNQAAVELGNVKIDGSLPQNENDIVVQKEYLKKLGLSASIGDTVSLNLGNGERDYVITGFAKSPAQSNTIFSILCSKAFLTAHTELDQRNYTVYAFLEMARAYSDTELNELLEGVRQDAGLTEDCGIMLNDATTSQLMITALSGIKQNVMAFASLTILLILASGIVIYNIFMISVRSSIREYGQLRTMGATQKQIKKMVSSEGKILMRIGIPLGLLLSCVISYLIMPDGFRWYIAIGVCAVTILFMLAVVKISMQTPVRAAIRTSPIEALRYGCERDEKIDRKNGKNIRLSPWNLAKVNFCRNRKKTVTIILSLILCGSLYVLGASSFSSMDIEKQARLNDLGKSDFVIMGSGSELENDIASISGITHTEYRYGSDFDWTLPNDDIRQSQAVSGFTKEEYEKDILPNLNANAPTYDQLVAENGLILFQADYLNYYCKSEPCKNGSSIILTEPQTQKSISFTVRGEYKRNYELGVWAGMPMELLNKSVPGTAVSAIGINGEKSQWRQINKELSSLSEQYGVAYQSIIKEIEKSNAIISTEMTIVYGIIFLLFLFAIINLVNTIITNIVSRQQEFGVLRAIALSKKQLMQMLYFENGMYAGTAVIISTLLGGIMGYCVVGTFSTSQYTYHFPLFEVVVLIAIMVLSIGTITALAIRSGAKKSIIEQINIIE